MSATPRTPARDAGPSSAPPAPTGRLRRVLVAAPPARVAVAAVAAALLALVLAPAVAPAHPLGNLSVNRLDVVRVSSDRVDVRWILDQAEIPTFQERGRPRTDVLAAKRATVARGLRLEADGRAVPLRLLSGGTIALRPGSGGLPVTRVELRLTARVDAPRRVVLRDSTFADRIGWRAILVAPGRGTDVRSDVPIRDATDRLRRYPADALSSPPDERVARLAVQPGSGQVTGPAGEGTGTRTIGGPGGFERLFSDAAAGRGVLVFLLLAALGWGAVHALSPGHGKAMMAAYLVGTRGRPRDAVLLGATVTITHTAGVLALGVVALGLSHWILPEDLYPWLTLASGLLVVAVGVSVLRGRVRHAHEHAHHHHLHDHHGHSHDHGHSHTHRHDRGQHPHGHSHTHDHDHDRGPGRRGPIALGVSAGLIPCPSALVVLLAAVAQHEIALGLVLIVAFSAGLALTLTGLGLAAVLGAGLARRHAAPRILHALPAVSAVVIVVAGVALSAQAVPQLA